MELQMNTNTRTKDEAQMLIILEENQYF